MLEIEPNAELAVLDNIMVRAFPEVDQYYAFDVESGDHFTLNATAHWVIERIKLNGHCGSLVESFANTFGLKKEEALRDVYELLEFALENKIIGRRSNEEEKSVSKTEDHKRNKDAVSA